MDDGRLLVSISTHPSCGLGQSRVGCTEQSGDALPREMIAQVATPDPRFGSKVTAVISARDGKKPTLADVQEKARQHIAGYKVPRELHIAPVVQRSPSGKPDYKWAKDFALSGEGLVS